MFAQDQPAFRNADFLRRHDFIGLAVLQNAVLMDAAFMGKGVAAHDGLVGLDHETRQGGDQTAGFVNFHGVDVGVERIFILAGLEHHDDFFQAGVTRPLPDAVDGAFHLTGAVLDGRDGVRDRQSQIVMAMDRNDRLVDIRNVVAQVSHHAAIFIGSSVTNGVRHIDRTGAMLDGGFYHPRQILPLGTRSVLGGKFHVIRKSAGQLDGVRGDGQGLFPCLAEQMLQMDVRGGNENMDASPFGRLDRLAAGFDVFFHGAGQTGDDGFFQGPGDFFHRLKITRGSRGKPGLNNIHAQLFQLQRHFHFFRGVQAGARRLFPVAQGGIKNVNSFLRRLDRDSLFNFDYFRFHDISPGYSLG